MKHGKIMHIKNQQYANNIPALDAAYHHVSLLCSKRTGNVF